MIRGVDVSSHQGQVDYAQVAGAGIEFVIAKATQSTGYVNPFYQAGREAARAAGLLLGSYHYAQPQLASAAAEAEHFLSTVGALQPGEFLCLDLEEGEGDLSGWALAWLRAVEARVGFKPLIYSGHWFMGPHGLEGKPELAQYGLWLAAYQTQFPNCPPAWPLIAIWQYSSTGRVPGVEGNCDLNLFNGSAEQLAAYGAPRGEVPAEWRCYGQDWLTVAKTLKAVADDALATGRRLKALAEQQAATWGGR